MITDSVAIQRRIAERKEKAAKAEEAALVAVLSTPEGRRVWLLIRNEWCRAAKTINEPDPVSLARRQGQDMVATLMDERVRDLPNLRADLARDTAQIEIDDAFNAADMARLKTEARNG